MALIEQVANRIEVAFRLRHLLAFDQQEFSMDPEPDERLPGRAFRLCNLVFMVREDQIDPAAVYVEGFSQVFHRHRRALEMPTGPAFTKRRWPPRFVPLFWLFPQHEVARISLFVFVDIHARARNISFELQSRPLAVTRESSDAVI